MERKWEKENKILSILTIAIMLAFVGWIVYLTSHRPPLITNVSVVRDKHVVPAHKSGGAFILDQGIMIPDSKIPNQFYLHFMVDGKETLARVTKDMFQQVQKGDQVRIHYRRYRRAIKITDISLE